MKNNYVKLTVRASSPLHDAEAVPQAPSSETFPLLPHGSPDTRAGEARPFVTTWIFPFSGTSGTGAKEALAAAQAKRKLLRTKHYTLGTEAFQLSTFAPSSIRGVLVVGDPRVVLRVVEAA